MGRNRKYEKVSGYWVYSIKIPSINKYYIGVSRCKECYQRWQKSLYNGTVLEPYLDEWDNMKKTVLVDNLTKEEAYQYEDALIQDLRFKDLCINTNRSGLIFVSDENVYQREYNKQYYENNKEQIQEQQKQYRENNKEKIRENNKQYYENNKEREKQRQKQWRENNPDYYKQYHKRKKLKKQQQQTSLQ